MAPHVFLLKTEVKTHVAPSINRRCQLQKLHDHQGIYTYNLSVPKRFTLDVPAKGSLQIEFFEKIGILSQRRGGGSANPKFLSNLSRTNFTLVNGQKCDETHST